MSSRLLLIALLSTSPVVPAGEASAEQHARRTTGTRAAQQKVERYQVAAGTALLVKLLTPLDSATAVVHQQVDATLWSPVVQDGLELIPTGSVLFGRVTAVERANERKPLGVMTITFSVVEHADTGDRATVNTRNIVIEATAPPPPPGKKAKIKPIDAVLTEGAPLVAVTAEPLLVRILK